MAHGRFGASSGHTQKTVMQRCLHLISFLFYYQCTKRVHCFLLAALDLGEDVTKHLPNRIFIRSPLPRSSSDMAHDLLHSHLSAGKECFHFTIFYVLTMALAAAFGDRVALG